jgi:hypothetical protein
MESLARNLAWLPTRLRFNFFTDLDKYTAYCTGSRHRVNLRSRGDYVKSKTMTSKAAKVPEVTTMCTICLGATSHGARFCQSHGGPGPFETFQRPTQMVLSSGGTKERPIRGIVSRTR